MGVSSLNSVPSARGASATLASVAVELIMALLAIAAAGSAIGAPPADEESVLVATREAPPNAAKVSTVVDEDALEPTPQSSDRTPDLAHSETEDASARFGEALIKIAQPQKHGLAGSSPQFNHDSGASPQAPSGGLEPSHPTNMDSGTARRAAAARAPDMPFEAVKFQGVAVGKTTKSALIREWGEPNDSTSTPDGDVLVFRKPPFQAIEILVGKNSVVSTIKITLAAPLDAKRLSEQLGLEQVAPVTISDDTARPLGLAFPERGVMFMFAEAQKVTPVDEDGSDSGRVPGVEPKASPQTAKLGGSSTGGGFDPSHAPRVSHVVIQPLGPHAFASRTEKHLHGPYTQNISDLKTALALDPEFSHAYYLLAKIYLATGQADLADAAAAEACDIEPRNATYQLCRGQCRELLGEYDDAVLTVRAVLDREDLASIDRAQALHQMARLASLGDGEIAAKTISFETRAIDVADKLAVSKDAKERRAAKQLLVEAHVSVAEEIARQSYNEKVDSMAQWVGRASGLAEDYIANDGGSVELRLFTAQRVLAGLASFRPTLDPAPWVAEAEEAAKTLLAQSNDEMWQQRVKWELGTAYLHALRVEHTRRQTDLALKYGQAAIDDLAIGASGRQAVHLSEQLVGQLYFQMGAIYAVHKLDHAKAIQWYEKAAPLLTAPRPASELYAPRREGEMLVSMGVSYWQVGHQAQALELTQTGVGLVEAAVESGVLAKSTLAVPYGNLATMYEQMGENTNAAKYQNLAKSVASPESKQAQPGTRQASMQQSSPVRNQRANSRAR
jgi:tetratricopeptide (TPR) repeat protein